MAKLLKKFIVVIFTCREIIHGIKYKKRSTIGNFAG